MKGASVGLWEQRVREYLSFRRRFGFSLRTTGDELRLFARHLDRIGHTDPLTIEVALQWAQQSKSARYAAWRLISVRMFGKHLAATDPRHEVPPAGALGRPYPRRDPHIYTTEEIESLLDATRTLKPTSHLTPHTYRTFFGLLAATGMRCGEALGLKRSDVVLEEGALHVERGKRGKERVLPLHATTVAVLREYASLRDTLTRKTRKSDAFFLTYRGTSLKYGRASDTFRTLRRELGWKMDPTPRVHDLRHTFAVRNLIRWCEDGEDVDTKIVALTNYLGHSMVTCTYWYFSAVPELMAIACRRFEEYAESVGDQ